MKRFKQLEVYSNILLYVALLILFLARYIEFFDAYFIMGGWQVLGMIVHASNGWFMVKNGSRYAYHWAVIIIFLAFLLGLILQPLAMLILYFLLYASPLLAILYISICFSELHQLNSRKAYTLSN